MNYPECERLRNNSEKICIIMDFLEWLYSKGIELPMTDHGTRVIVHHYFGIDQNKLERERQHMIEHCQIVNEHSSRSE